MVSLVIGQAWIVSEIDQTTVGVPRIHQIGATPIESTAGYVADHGQWKEPVVFHVDALSMAGDEDLGGASNTVNTPPRYLFPGYLTPGSPLLPGWRSPVNIITGR